MLETISITDVRLRPNRLSRSRYVKYQDMEAATERMCEVAGPKCDSETAY
jgi:hypothetical protein